MAAYGGPAPNIGSLLSLDGEAFVRQAYKRLLNRDADAAGLNSCLEKLRAGVPKETILTAMESTPEGRLARRRRGGLSFATRSAGAPSLAKPLSPQPGDVQQLLALEAGEFLQHAYFLVLGRRADPEGLQSFLARMESGETAAQILRDLALSDEAKAYGHRLAGLPEWLRSSAERPPDVPHVTDIAQLLAIADDAGFVNATYWYALGRPADQSGFAHLGHLMATGTPREVILREIASSSEGLAAGHEGLPGLAEWLHAPAGPAGVPLVADVAQLLAIADDAGFLNATYWYALGRPADQSGFAHLEQLIATGTPREVVLREIATSSEGIAAGHAGLPGLAEWLAAERSQEVDIQNEIPPEPVSHVNELLAIAGEDDFLRAAYWNVMGRAIDLPGYKNCKSLLGLGWSRLHILQGLRNSDEGRRAGASLAGLDGRLRNYEKAQKRSWSGWYRRSVLGAESDMPADRQLRAIYRSVTR